jgi:hypothetical protein
VSTPCRPAERAAHLSTVAEMLDDPDENVRWEVPVSTLRVPRKYPRAPCESTTGSNLPEGRVNTLIAPCEYPVSTLITPCEYPVSTLITPCEYP